MTRIGMAIAVCLFVTGVFHQTNAQAGAKEHAKEFKLRAETITPKERQELYLQLIEDFVGPMEQQCWVNTDKLEKNGGYYDVKQRKGDAWARSNSDMCRILAVLLAGRPSETTFTKYNISRSTLESRLEKTIRSLCLSNRNYSQKKSSRWGGPSWTASLGFTGAAWATIIQEGILDSSTIIMADEVLGHEADALKKPIAYYTRAMQTAAEDCMWNSNLLALAANKLSSDPRAASWDEWAKKWAINSVAMPGDSKDDKTIVDGHPLSHWISGWNIFSDFTLENHYKWHPEYQAEYGRMAQAEMAYKHFGNPIPQAFSFRHAQMWDELGKILLLPDGCVVYPQGAAYNPWGALKEVTHLYYPAWHATARQEPAASAFESRAVQFARKRQIDNGHGLCGSRDNYRAFYWYCDVFGSFAMCWQMHNYWTSASTPYEVAAADSYCVRKYNDSKAAIHRNSKKIVTVSWHPYGQAIHIKPKGAIDTFPNPPFYFPWYRHSGVNGNVSNPSLHNFQSTHDGLGMRVTVKRPLNSDVDQYITMVSLPDEATVYSAIFHAKNNTTYSVGRLFPLQARWLVESPGSVTQHRGKNWLNMSDHVAFVSPKPLPENIPAEKFWLTGKEPTVPKGKLTSKYKPNPKYPLEHTSDGNASSWWVSHDSNDPTKGPSPQRPDWIEITYPTPREISRVMLKSRPNYGPRECELLCSDDGKHYRSIRKLTAKNTEEEQVFDFKPLQARRFRLQIVSAFDRSRTSARNAQICELSFAKCDDVVDVKAGQWFSPAVAVVYVGQPHEQTKKLSEKINLVEDLSNKNLKLKMSSSTGQAVINLWPAQ